MTCTGKWCIDNKFICGRSGNTDCYHVEHIIDENGPEFKNCYGCKNIAGNMVMAYGRWNKALGGLSLRYYNDSTYEKQLVYGADILDRVRDTIWQCMYDGLRDKISNKNISYTSFDYNPYCDNDLDCNCDSDSICGCDCSDDDNNTNTHSIFNNEVIFSSIIMTEIFIIFIILVLLICYYGKKAIKSNYLLVENNE